MVGDNEEVTNRPTVKKNPQGIDLLKDICDNITKKMGKEEGDTYRKLLCMDENIKETNVNKTINDLFLFN